MLKRTAYRLLSASWRPHAEQLKQWIAGTAACKGIQLARTYMHNLKLDEVMEEIDDCCDFVALMQECGYPVGGRHHRWIQSFIALNASSISSQTIIDITKRLETHPSSFNHFRTTFFLEPRFISRMKEIIPTLPSEHFASFAYTFWELAWDFQRLPADLEPFAHSFSSAVSARLRAAPNPCVLMLSLSECSFPLSHNSLKELSTELVMTSNKLSRKEAFLLIDHIATYSRRKYDAWLIALQRTYLNEPVANASIKELVYLMKALIRIKVEFIPEVTELIVACIHELSGNQLLSFARSMRQHAVGPRTKLHLSALLNDIQKRLDPCLAAESKNPEQVSELIACLSQFDSVKAKQLLLGLLQDFNLSSIATKSIANTCIAMNSVNYYPVEAAIMCQAKLDLEVIDQDEAIHIVHAFMHLGGVGDNLLVRKAHGKCVKRSFTHRKRLYQRRPAIFRDSLVLLVVSMVGLCENDEFKELRGIALELLNEGLLDKEEKILLLLKLRDSGSSGNDVRKKIVMDLISHLNDEFSSLEYQIILETLSALAMRDANAFAKVLSHMKRSHPSIQEILCAAETAHTLQLIPQFEASNIFECYDNFSECDADGVFHLLRLCTPIQRNQIAGQAQIKDILHHLDLSSIPTADLFILFNLSSIGLRDKILKQLTLRAPLEEDGIDAEELIMALEQLQKDGLLNEFERIFRVGSCALQKVSENQLVRLFNCMKHLSKGPNIVYRVMGKVLLKMIDKISADCAIMWLWLYFESQIRDDGVGRALARKGLRHSVFLSKESLKKLQCAAKFYGLVQNTRSPSKAKKRPSYPINFHSF